ncbi:MAG: dihydrodipicolinate synthase family protein [Pirellulaceae bacterium]|nr:MAG: dihydrodipicolinate synthase family protein [Pirellulaceae bacterium]
MVTPLAGRDTLDTDGLARLLHRLLDGGVHGIFVLGTTGEAPSLSHRLQREVVRNVCQIVRRRVPVVVGITDTALAESIALARVAAEEGADAVVASTPYYFPAGQTELRQYMETLAAEVALPLYLYNIPSLTKLRIDVETVERLMHVPTIRGIKDSSGDLTYFSRLVDLKKHRADWSVLMGPEHLLAEAIQAGADGGVHGGANIFPHLFARWYTALDSHDLATAGRLKEQVALLQSIYQVGKYDSRFVKATKCALSLLGICSDRMAEPLNAFHPPERQRVAEVLQRLASMDSELDGQ